jgi:hypothetical protein
MLRIKNNNYNFGFTPFLKVVSVAGVQKPIKLHLPEMVCGAFLFLLSVFDVGLSWSVKLGYQDKTGKMSHPFNSILSFIGQKSG